MTNEMWIVLSLLFGTISAGLLGAAYLHFRQRRMRQRR